MTIQTPPKRVLLSHTLKAFGLGVFVVLSLVLMGLRLTTGYASAAASSTINFQARLQTASGSIAPDGAYNVDFKLYNASSGGSALWTETRQNSNAQGVTVKNGYVTVNLGAVTAFPGTIDWSQQLWLTMNVGGTANTASPTWDGEMNPRLQLTASAYAFMADQANKLKTSTGTVTGDQLVQLSPASTQTGNVNISGNVVAGGSLQGSSATLGNATTQGLLVLNTGTGQTGTIKVGAMTGSYSYTIPVTAGNDTFCLQTLKNCGAGVSTIGALDGATYSANGASISGSTLYLQAATGSHVGLVTTGTQTFAGNKTFTGTVVVKNTSTTAFQVQDASNATTLTVDTSTRTVSIGAPISYNVYNYTLGSGFAAHADYATGSSPYGVTSADFNGDGKSDMAVANQGTNTVSILLGNGDGTMQSKVDYATGSSPYGVTVADFNGDGKQDLVVVNYSYSGTVSVLLGNGDGTMQPKVDYVAGQYPEAVTTADLNGDGKQDLVISNWGSNSVSVLLGNGDGTFQAKVDYATGSSPYGVTSADFNGDGKRDLVAGNYNANTVSVLLGNGDGTMQPKVDYGVGSNPRGLTAADFNGDGKRDVVVTNSNSGTVSVLLGNGDGTFQAKVDYATGYGPYSVTAVDFSGDGMLDLVTANYGSSSVSVLLGNGDGTFQAKVDYATGTNPDSVAAADFNGDGKPDMAVANYNSNNVSLLINGATMTTTVVNAGLSVTAPSANQAGIFVKGASGQAVDIFRIQSSSDALLLNVTKNGNVGIGLTTPGYKLDVSGDINTSSTYRVGGIAGASISCSGGQVLQNQVVQGGIVTGGSCASASGGVSSLNALTGALSIQGNSQIAVSATSPNISLSIQNDSIGDAQLVYDTGQNLTTTSSVNFNFVTLSNGVFSPSGNIDYLTNKQIVSSGYTDGSAGIFSGAAGNSYPTLITKQAGSSTADLLQAQDSSGNELFSISSAGMVSSVAGYQFNGTAGSTKSCTGGQYLQDATVQGGIVTGGSCASAGGGGITTIGTLDSAGYNTSANGATIFGSTLYLQSASTSYAGLVNTGTQTFAGDKTFIGANTYFNGNTYLGSGSSLATVQGSLSIAGQTGVGNSLSITNAPAASGTSSVIQIGSAIQGGNANGTYLGLNAPSGSQADWLNFQQNGNSYFKVDGSGNLTAYTLHTLSSGGTSSIEGPLDVGVFANDYALRVRGQPLASSTAAHTLLSENGISGGNANGTYLGLNAASGYTGDLLDFQVGGTKMLTVDNNGYVFSQTGFSTINASMTSGQLTATSITANGGYNYAGTAGTTKTCTAGQYLDGAKIQGGIVTGGTCATVSGGSGSGVTAIGALDGGTANATGATISGSTLYLQSASNSYAGLVNTGTQSFAGDKTFNGQLTVNGFAFFNQTVNLSDIYLNGVVHGKLQVVDAPTASGTSSLLQIGNAIQGGNANGTYLGLNAASGYAGDFLNFQKGGASKLTVDTNGSVTSSGYGSFGGGLTVSGGSLNVNVSSSASITGSLGITLSGPSIQASGAFTGSSTINAVSGFKFNGTAGSSKTCTGGQYLQDATVQGGIVTAGTCVSGSLMTNVAQTFTGVKTFQAGMTIGGNFVLQETAAPTASTGYGKLYVSSSDHNLHFLNASGVDIALGAGGGGGYSGTRTIKIAPEFPNAVFTTGGQAATTGYMQTDLDTGLSAAQGYKHTYYSWTTDQATSQTYDITMLYQVPSDFTSFASGSFKIWAYGTDSTKNGATIIVKDADGTQCMSQAVSITNATWIQTSLPDLTSGGCTFAANDLITITVRPSSSTAVTNETRIGEFQFAYN